MRLVPLLTLLLTMTLVATSLSRGAESPGCTPAPLHPSSPAPLPPSTECNRPASDMPPAPDGCPDYAPIAPPTAPIPPPCITDAQAERWDEEDTAVTELTIYEDHPELGQGVRTYTKLTHIQHSAFSIPNSEWELVDADWEVSCGKDEGPLVWALLTAGFIKHHLRIAGAQGTITSTGSAQASAMASSPAPIGTPRALPARLTPCVSTPSSSVAPSNSRSWTKPPSNTPSSNSAITSDAV